MPCGVVILDHELVIFACHIQIHFAREHISSQADIYVGKPGIDGVEDGLSERQSINVLFASFGGFVADDKFLHEADFSVALLVVDWAAHELVFTFNALFQYQKQGD